MHYVGIDRPDEKHDIYITNDSGKELVCFEISNDRKGMFKLLAKAQKWSKDTSSVLFAMEKSSGPCNFREQMAQDPFCSSQEKGNTQRGISPYDEGKIQNESCSCLILFRT